MKIINKYLVILSVLFFSSLSAHGQVVDTLVALPGKGLVINSDTIFVDKTSVDEAMKILNIKEKPELNYGISHGINLTEGKEESETFVGSKLKYSSITFEYEGRTEADLQLQWIKIPTSGEYVVKLPGNVIINKNYPHVISSFPKETEFDYISSDSLTFNLYSHGISFQIEKMDSEKILKEVSIHYTIDSSFTNNSAIDLDARLDSEINSDSTQN